MGRSFQKCEDDMKNPGEKLTDRILIAWNPKTMSVVATFYPKKRDKKSRRQVMKVGSVSDLIPSIAGYQEDLWAPEGSPS